MLLVSFRAEAETVSSDVEGSSKSIIPNKIMQLSIIANSLVVSSDSALSAIVAQILYCFSNEIPLPRLFRHCKSEVDSIQHSQKLLNQLLYSTDPRVL